MTSKMRKQLRRLGETFHSDLYVRLRAQGYGAARSRALATIECCECGGYADHWHTMTGTTLDECILNLNQLLPDNRCTVQGPLACGSEVRLSLDPDDPSVPAERRYLCGEWYPHCEQCSQPICEDCGERHDPNNDCSAPVV